MGAVLDKAQMRALIGVRRHEVALPPWVATALANIIAETLETTNSDKVQSMTKPEVLDLLQRGLSYQSVDAMPVVYTKKVSRWFGFSVT